MKLRDVPQTGVATGSLEDTQLFEVKMNRLDQIAKQGNPFYDCRYSLRACHGIAKAILMLNPNGRQSSKPPSLTTIEKVRRFLKVKVKRFTKDLEMSSQLPTVEQLMVPNLFQADLSLYSHLRIRGKEYLDPSILPKTIWLAVCALNIQADMDTNTDAPVPIDEEGRFVAFIHESKVPNIAHWLMTYCVIPGGPWAVHQAVRGGLPVSPTNEAGNFAKMQAQLLQGSPSNETKRTVRKEEHQTVKLVYEW